MKANDGKMRLTDVAAAEQLLRIIQSIPSPKAEPFKRWLARVGAERMEEEVDPQKAIDRARATYLAKGYPEPWIKARLQGIQARNELTDEWKAHGVQDQQYAILTNIIHRGTFDLSVREHKALKGLKKENSQKGLFGNVGLERSAQYERSAQALHVVAHGCHGLAQFARDEHRSAGCQADI